jgi:hypothetical protein
MCPAPCQKFRNNILTPHFMFWHQLMCNNSWTHFWISQLLNYFIHFYHSELQQQLHVCITSILANDVIHMLQGLVCQGQGSVAAMWFIIKPGVTFFQLSHTIHPAHTCASINNKIRHLWTFLTVSFLAVKNSMTALCLEALLLDDILKTDYIWYKTL